MGTAIGELIPRQEISLDYLKGQKIGIDSHNVLYQFLSSIRGQDGTPLMDSNGNITSHLTGLLYRTTNILSKGLKPVFVFDGKPSTLKTKTLEERKKTRTEAIQKHEKALKEGNLEEARKFGSRALKLTPEMIEESKQLIELMGLPVVEAPTEGEAQIAFMASRKEVFGCASQDFDALLFGAPRLLRNINITGKRKLPGKNIYIDAKPELIELEKVLKQLGIGRKKLVWIGILIGTDFNEKFPKAGPKTALKLVRENDTFRSIVKKTRHTPDFDFKEIEELFLNPETTTDYEIKFGLPQKDKIISFLCGKHDFSRERVENALEKIDAIASEKGEQSQLNKWF